MDNEYTPTPYEIYSVEPESLGVGKLNNIVKALREEHYQYQLKVQDLAALVHATHKVSVPFYECEEPICQRATRIVQCPGASYLWRKQNGKL